MLAIFSYIEDISVSGQPVLITGETGTGKEMIAEAVHKCSARHGRFVTVNVAGLDDNIFSDTLFGHEKGAFTGADRKRDGLIQTASGGTIFLDEIGDLSHNSQVKLLRLIQQGEYYPLGSDLPKMSDAAIVVATNKTTDYLKNSEHFRSDLYYRLKTHHVALPPLRHRKDDIKPLAESFFKDACVDFNRRPFEISEKIYPMLEAYSFPGNIRELKSLVSEAVSLNTNTKDFTEYFEGKLLSEIKNSGTPAQSSAANTVTDTKAFVKLPTMDEMELILINEALRRCSGKRNEAAEMIGITRQTLHRRLKSGPPGTE
jgi:DNA-binding NtrC family response regulator